jgi:hypothetical protein
MKSCAAAALLLLGACGEGVSVVPSRGEGDASADAGLDGGDAGWTPPAVALPDDDSDEPFFLSQTGLYVDLAAKQLAPDLFEFEPTYTLWSDGADKRRWLRLPRGERIDSSDPDHWTFPVGTMLFKEFSRVVSGQRKRLETRLIARTGEGVEDYFMGAFLWNDDESDARFVPDGYVDARGTGHDVPKVKFCFTCHNGDRGRVLGFSTVQQARVDPALLTHAVDGGYRAPGDAATEAALGYLHANCGHCHNPAGTARPDTDMDLRLLLSDRSPEDTAAYTTTIGIELQYFDDSPLTLRVVPGDAEQSGLLFRMSMRGPDTQMPPLATELVDDAGVALVRAWIESLR